jgi:hypothetical protein
MEGAVGVVSKHVKMAPLHARKVEEEQKEMQQKGKAEINGGVEGGIEK